VFHRAALFFVEKTVRETPRSSKRANTNLGANSSVAAAGVDDGATAHLRPGRNRRRLPFLSLPKSRLHRRKQTRCARCLFGFSWRAIICWRARNCPPMSGKALFSMSQRAGWTAIRQPHVCASCSSGKGNRGKHSNPFARRHAIFEIVSTRSAFIGRRYKSR